MCPHVQDVITTAMCSEPGGQAYIIDFAHLASDMLVRNVTDRTCIR